MKLYSKNYLVITICITFILTVAISFTIFSFTNKHIKSNNYSNSTSQIISSGTTTDEDTYLFQTNYQTDIAMTSELTDNFSTDELQNISVYERCSDAVVNISTKVITYSWFYEPYPTDGGSGSGSIIDKRGYVVTNRHVIKDAYKIYISLSDGTQYEGELVGQDDQTDLAIVKFTPPKNVELKTIPFSDSTKLRVGQKVIAIGNPFGFDRTMTTGIISSLGRPIQSNDIIFRDMIQTDTAINPGNSGGPLLDTQGKIIGINTIIYSTSGSSAGVGFAIPVNTAKRILTDLMNYGKVKRGMLKVSLVQLNSTLARYANLQVSEGLLVSEVTKNSNAEKSGIKGGTEAARYNRSSQVFYLGGDIIIAINGRSVSSSADYNSVLENTKPNDVVTITVLRGSERIDITTKLEEN